MLEQLVNKIAEARKQYWETGTSNLSDSEYDQLLIQLESNDPSHPLLTEVEFKEEIDPSLKVKHPTPLLSLDKKYTKEDMFAWMSKVARSPDEKFVITPKYDGLACRWYVKDRILATRGEGGIEGENITEKIPLIDIEGNSAVSFIGSNPPKTDIAGELLCKTSVFNNTNLTRSNGKPYATERNLVAGVINNIGVEQFLGKIRLNFVDYNTNRFVRTIEGLNGEFDDIVSNLINLDYPTDGIVIALEDTVYADSLGITSHHPKHSVALKFPDEEKEATLLSVTFQMGKSKITPVANITPTLLDGVNVQRITMHNAKFCIDNDIQIGDTLIIKRAGRVIPNIVRSIPGETRTPISIDSCPSCGGAIIYDEPFLKCKSKDCGGSIQKKLEYAAKVLGLDVLGPGTISKCIEEFGCRTILDLIDLAYEDFLEIEGFAETSAQNAADAIASLVSTPQPDYNILASVGVSGLGTTVWKKLLVEYTVEELLAMDNWDLERLNDIGPERASLIYDTLNNDETNAMIGGMYECFDVISTKGSVAELKKVCFSGNFPHPKKHYADIASSKGYEVVTSVTKSLDLLVNNGAVTSKVSKAQSYGIRVVNIDDFISKF